MSIFNATNKYQTVKLRFEDELLLCCARTDVNPEIRDKILFLIKNDLDWDYLLKLASRHRVMPLLYHNLNSVCPELIPEGVLSELNDNFNANVRKNLMMTGELIKVLNLLESEGITAIPYKGPVLALMAYGNIGLRQFNDLDIFIPEAYVLKAKKLLKSNEYLLYPQRDPKPEFHYIRTQREYKFVSDINKIVVEIHWRFQGLSNKTFIDQKHFKDITINNKNISTFSNEDLLLVLSTHCANHSWASLSWIFDITQLIKTRNINWQFVLKKANKHGIKKILLINLILSMNLFGLQVPNEISNILSSESSVKNISVKILNNLFEENEISLVENAVMQFTIRDTWIKGIKFCLWRAFSPTSIEWNSLYLPEVLFPLYYLYRPMRLLHEAGFKVEKNN